MLINKNLNFLEFLFINNFFTEEEARQLLIEEGVNIEEIDSKAKEFLQKLNAMELKLKSKIKKAEFEKNLKEFQNSNEDNALNINYSLAARKGTSDEIKNNDEELFNFIKKKNKTD